ncbi:hypothetical protein HDU85_001178 [Gaertneriomyces sp. JEL0708]|nr:hypothetical protein HDU85_001178 [Gaertneriomyces sp. JEL0708]
MPHFDILDAPPAATARLISSHLARLSSRNDALPPKQYLTRFHARTIPSIDVHGYVARILKYAPCGNECFLAVLVYLERLVPDEQRVLMRGYTGKRGNEGEDAVEGLREPKLMRVDSYNVHRLLIAGIVVAVKFLSDVFFTNRHMSKVGGLPVTELNSLELEFLTLHNFNLNVAPEEVQYCGDRLLELDALDSTALDTLFSSLQIPSSTANSLPSPAPPLPDSVNVPPALSYSPKPMKDAGHMSSVGGIGATPTSSPTPSKHTIAPPAEINSHAGAASIPAFMKEVYRFHSRGTVATHPWHPLHVLPATPMATSSLTIQTHAAQMQTYPQTYASPPTTPPRRPIFPSTAGVAICDIDTPAKKVFVDRKCWSATAKRRSEEDDDVPKKRRSADPTERSLKPLN